MQQLRLIVQGVFSAHAEVVPPAATTPSAWQRILRARGGSSHPFVSVSSASIVFSAHAEVVPGSGVVSGAKERILRARGGSSIIKPAWDALE